MKVEVYSASQVKRPIRTKGFLGFPGQKGGAPPSPRWYDLVGGGASFYMNTRDCGLYRVLMTYVEG